MKRSDAIHLIQDHKIELHDRYPISVLYLFGSVARDEAQSDSDIDLLVEFYKPVGLFEFIALQQELERILGCKVDLGTPRSIKMQLKEDIMQEAIRVA